MDLSLTSANFDNMGSLGVFFGKPQVHLDACIAMATWYGRHMEGCLSGEIRGGYGKIKAMGYLIFDT